MTSMRGEQIQNLLIEIHKILPNLNPELMHQLFDSNSSTVLDNSVEKILVPSTYF